MAPPLCWVCWAAPRSSVGARPHFVLRFLHDVASCPGSALVDPLTPRTKAKIATKVATEYKDVQTLPPALAAAGPAGPKKPAAPAGPGAAGPGVKLITGPEAQPWVSSFASFANVQVCERSWDRGTSSTTLAGQVPASAGLWRRGRPSNIAPLAGAHAEEGGARGQAGVSPAVEVVKGHLGSYGMGARGGCRPGEQVVRHRCRRSCYQGESRDIKDCG